MNPGKQKSIRNPAMYAVAGVLALNLAACGDKGDDSTKPVPVAIPAPPAMEKKAGLSNEMVAPKAALTGKAAENAALTTKVKSALAAERDVDAIAIDVDAKDGVVSLFGTADSDASRDKAARAASKVEGVKSVVNRLVISKGS